MQSGIQAGSCVGFSDCRGASRLPADGGGRLVSAKVVVVVAAAAARPSINGSAALTCRRRLTAAFQQPSRTARASPSAPAIKASFPA